MELMYFANKYLPFNTAKNQRVKTYGVAMSSSRLWGGVSSLKPESEVRVNSLALLQPPGR